MQKFLACASTPIQFLPGVGPALATRLKALSIHTFWDCLAHLPRDYEVYAPFPQTGQKLLIAAEISSIQKGKSSWRFLCRPLWRGQPSFGLLFFRKPHPLLSIGSRWVFGGLLTEGFWMHHPEEILPWQEETPPFTHISPIYPACKGLSSKKLNTMALKILQRLPAVPDWNPSEEVSFIEALHLAHKPLHLDHIKADTAWRRRLAFDEYLAYHLASLEEASHYRQRTALPCPYSLEADLKARSYFGLPLTECQEKAWKDITSDLQKETPMMRLLHGEVGSGKTVLALMAMIQVVAQQQQACLLAPTELLARQHAHTLKALAPDQPIALVLSEYKKDVSGIAEGSFRLVVGTHALFQDPICFASLNLVIVDEQQRFGVAQRLKLTQKGDNPHLLLMSATPIPRSLELALFEHLSVSRLVRRSQSPSIQSYVVPSERMADVLPWIKKCLQSGEAVYWVCPKIGTEEDEGAVMRRFLFLSQHFPGQTGLLHGQMKNAEKLEAMEAFRLGKLPLLVSTTVVETGLHVDEATTIVIEDSHRFGMAQLHQLRGRVGRAHKQGHCFFLYTKPLSDVSYKRLQTLRACQDGFILAEEDWRLRGGGERFGLAQSGGPAYKFVDPVHHGDLFFKAHTLAKIFLKNNPDVASILISLLSGYYEDAVLAG